MNKRASKSAVVFLSTFPPNECGIATYMNDLLGELKKIVPEDLELVVYAIENYDYRFEYPPDVHCILDTTSVHNFLHIAYRINNNDKVKAVFIQHEFGLFGGKRGDFILFMLKSIHKPIYITFHTVLPEPDDFLKSLVEEISEEVQGIITMTSHSADILISDYGIAKNKIFIIPHGTHSVDRLDKLITKRKYGFENRFILSTFGLLSRNKNIETVLDALAPLADDHPEILYLIVGKTHPGVIRYEGEAYRDLLNRIVIEKKLQRNVMFLNRYLNIGELLDYLKLSDLYIFSSKDKNQAVSGTLSYAIGTGLPVVSTPIPHAKEILGDSGFIFDFEDSSGLSHILRIITDNPELLEELRINALKKANRFSWDKIALKYLEIIYESLHETEKDYPLPHKTRTNKKNPVT